MVNMKILAILPLLTLSSCSSLTPAEQAVVTRLSDKALAVGEAKLDQWLGLPPAAVVVPNASPVGAVAPAGIAVKPSGK